MGRITRKRSSSGYYHIMIRGVNRELIFIDDMDRGKFIALIKQYVDETKTDIIVYCLMSNHVHMLVKAPEGMSSFMRKLASAYVYYFNHKYDRIGHLFQDRYKSEPIETDSYLLTAARYILKNPEKAGICEGQEYKWSSWRDLYYLAEYDKTGFTKPQVLFDIAGGPREFMNFLMEDSDDVCLDIDSGKRISDEKAKEAIIQITGLDDPKKLSDLYSEQVRGLLIRMKESGLSVRQISRITGVDRNIVFRAK